MFIEILFEITFCYKQFALKMKEGTAMEIAFFPHGLFARKKRVSTLFVNRAGKGLFGPLP